jgi:hypothetical protein
MQTRRGDPCSTSTNPRAIKRLNAMVAVPRWTPNISSVPRDSFALVPPPMPIAFSMALSVRLLLDGNDA